MVQLFHLWGVKKNADDYATTEDVIMEVVDNYRRIGKEYDYVCCLYPTTPFITGDILNRAMQIMEDKNLQWWFR